MRINFPSKKVERSREQQPASLSWERERALVLFTDRKGLVVGTVTNVDAMAR